jgi:tetratricopeptide (TPR) repeat protein
LLSAIEDDFPRHVKVYLARGYLDEVENDLEAARRTYLEAADLVIDPPQRREILLSVADLDRRRGNRVEAQAMLDRLSQECGESVRSRQLRISLLVEEGRITDALREVTRMAEENPGNPLASRLRRQLEGLAAGVSARGLPSGSSSSTTR